MKKIKIRKKKKYKKKHKYTKLNHYSFSPLLLLFIIFFIIIFILILFFSLNKIIYKRKGKQEIKIKNEVNDYNKILYKGEMISKDILFNDYFSRIHDFNTTEEKVKFNKTFNLPIYSDDISFRNIIKKQFLELASIKKNKNISKIETFYATVQTGVGNSVSAVNNMILYCDIIGCNKIILKDNSIGRKWLIKNPLYIKNLNITIMQGHDVDCNNDNNLCLYETGFDFFPPFMLKPDVRINYFKDEILRNLPIVNIDPEALYIHLRGGDIFKNSNPSPLYAQPPLCFYEKIIDNNKFNKIYIIAQDRTNVVINPLINKYKYIIFESHNWEYDLSIFVHAYNIVLTTSSFSLSAIKFNDNLRNIWEYDMMRLTEKFVFLHHHLYKMDIKYKIYTMKPSDTYISKMFHWTRTETQVKLMLEENCPYDFVLTKPNT